VAVTDEGRDLLLRAGPLVDGLREALASAADRRAEPSGLVRVTAPAYTGATRVAAALADFAREHPQVTIELDPSNAIRDLVEERFDFGVRVGPVVDVDFVARKLWSGAFGLFAAPSLAKRLGGKRASLTREALARAPCVVTRPGGEWRFRDERGRSVAVRPTARFAVNDPRAAIEVARRGVGVVLAPVDAAVEAGLVALETDFGSPEPVDLYVVYPSRRLLPRRVRLAIDWLAQPRYAGSTSA
jgi:DNA-binding transcriptional LysR family regulator